MYKVSRENVSKARDLILKLMGLIDRRLDNSTIDLMAACEISCNLTKVLTELERTLAHEA